MADETQRKQWREYNRRRRAAAAKAGICSTCLARENQPGRAQCRVCREKARVRRVGAA